MIFFNSALVLVSLLLRSVRGDPLSSGKDHRHLYTEDGVDWEGWPLPGFFQYELINVTEVAGRQGVATDGKMYYVSGSKALYLYDMDWNLLLSNEDPFAIGYTRPVNHLGDISVFEGEIYAGAEFFDNGRGKDIQIAIYNATTLEFTRTFPWDASSGQIEVSGIAVDAVNDAVWMTEWNVGDYVYRYNLQGDYIGKLHLLPSPQWQQGVVAYNGTLMMTADDGNADRKEYDHLWSVKGGLEESFVRYEMTVDQVKDYGEIEGLDVDRIHSHLLILHNRGAIIRQGIPSGFYPGYNREIHEVYTFKMIDASSTTDKSNADYLRKSFQRNMNKEETQSLRGGGGVSDSSKTG